jgi:hypothetical protein
MQSLRASLAILTIFTAGIMVVYGLTSTSVRLSSSGSVKALGVGVYWDSACSQTVSGIDWGSSDPGSVKNVTVYIRNEGTAPITLSLQTANWNPAEAEDYISLSWDYGGQAIGVNQVLTVTLSLSISSNIQGITTFSFDIVVVGSG